MFKRPGMSLSEYRRYCENAVRPLYGNREALERWRDDELWALDMEYLGMLGVFVGLCLGMLGVIWLILILTGGA